MEIIKVCLNLSTGLCITYLLLSNYKFQFHINHPNHLKYKNADFKHAESQAIYKMSDKVMNMSNILPDTPKKVSTQVFFNFGYLPICFLSKVISLEMRQSISLLNAKYE